MATLRTRRGVTKWPRHLKTACLPHPNHHLTAWRNRTSEGEPHSQCCNRMASPKGVAAIKWLNRRKNTHLAGQIFYFRRQRKKCRLSTWVQAVRAALIF